MLVLLLAATGGVHAALASTHGDEGAAVQIVFALSAAAAWAAALFVDRDGGRRATAGAAVMFTALIAAYAATRLAVVWPFEHAEPVDALGALTKLLEGVGLGLALVLLQTHADRPHRAPAQPKELAR